MKIIIAFPATAAAHHVAKAAKIERLKGLIAATKAQPNFKTSERLKASVARRLGLIKDLSAAIKAGGKAKPVETKRPVKAVAPKGKKTASGAPAKTSKKKVVAPAEKAKAKPAKKPKAPVGVKAMKTGKGKTTQQAQKATAKKVSGAGKGEAGKKLAPTKAVSSPVKVKAAPKAPPKKRPTKGATDKHTGRKVVVAPVKVKGTSAKK